MNARPKHRLWNDQLAADLAVLEQAYAEHQHRFPSDWLDYGELDPAEADARLIFPSKVDGAVPSVQYQQTGLGSRVIHEHRIVVGKTTIGPFREGWQAIIEWNKSDLSQTPGWCELPFFFIGELEPDAARFKLGVLRSHLELRARLLKMRAMSGQRVGRGFLNRVKAYLAWCELSQTILKSQTRHLRGLPAS